MGKDLKGKELGVGISQRADGLYTARYTTKGGHRKQKYFKKLQECKKWLADAQYYEKHGSALNSEEPMVDAWFNYWMTDIKANNIRYNTIRNYTDRYRINIKPYIGEMLIKDVKPMHCQNILNNMSKEYKISTIEKCRTVMQMLFDCAVENEIILRSPITKSIKCTSGKKCKEVRALTVDEQKLFLHGAKEANNKFYNQYAFLLQTGLRVGELMGLKWQDIDFPKRIIHVRRTMEYRAKKRIWAVGEPKTKKSVRDVPLTREAENLLKDQKEKNREIKVIPLEFADYIFLNNKGIPVKSSAYNTRLYSDCDKYNIKRFSMHTFRHTYATRCIENGMRPKTLQIILGHSNINITMNLYVHVTEDEKQKEVENIEGKLKLV